MKTILFIFLMLCPLWACSSCEDEDNKLPGSKPEILLGKWESCYELYWSYTIRSVVETIEFTKSGGSITEVTTYTYPVDYKPVDTFVNHFTNWSYDGHSLHFIYKKGGYSNPWSKSVSELTPDYFILDTGGSGDAYYKVK